jgi:hypothetical protein
MGKGEFVRVYLRRTQEKLERVLETDRQSGPRMIDLNSYKRMEVDSKTKWSVESIACILRRNACRCGYKIRKCRTF